MNGRLFRSLALSFRRWIKMCRLLFDQFAFFLFFWRIFFFIFSSFVCEFRSISTHICTQNDIFISVLMRSCVWFTLYLAESVWITRNVIRWFLFRICKHDAQPSNSILKKKNSNKFTDYQNTIKNKYKEPACNGRSWQPKRESIQFKRN